MYASQFNYDMAEPDIDPLQEAAERAAEQLDEGDSATALSFAEYTYAVMSHKEIIEAMASLFSVTDSKWRTLRGRLDDVVGGPLDCLRICMDEHRENFLAERATQLMEAAE